MTTNKILEIELELKKNGLTNLGITVFKKKFLQKYEVALLIGPNEPFFWDIFKYLHELIIYYINLQFKIVIEDTKNC